MDDDSESIETTENSDNNSDWPQKASQMVVQYVDTVRNKTTGPALVASRYAVYMFVIAIIGIIALILGFILLIRLLIISTGKLSFVESGQPWLAYFIVGGLCLLVGAFLWRKKEPRKNDDD